MRQRSNRKIKNSILGILLVLLITPCANGIKQPETMVRVETTDFVFYHPRGFVPVPLAIEKEVIFFYGDGHGNSISVSRLGYLAGRDLSEAVCTELTEAFNNSKLRTMANGSTAMAKEFASKDGLKSCYYYYDFKGPKGTSRLEYKVYQGGGFWVYAITIVYYSNSLQKELLQEALHSFKVK